MADLITRLKNMSNNTKNCSDAEIQFLEKSDLSIVLDRAFNEVYRLRPQNPILFLSKWLTRESRARELAKKYFEDEQKRSKLQEKFYKEEKQKQLEKLKKEEQIKLRKKDENNLVQEIKDCKDFWLGFNHICQRLKGLINATGCYIGIYDLKRRPVMEDDDETGHIDPSNSKVLRYIGWNDDHSFLDGKYLEQNQGVTFELIFPQLKNQPPAEGGENPPTQNNNPEQKPPEVQQVQNQEKKDVNPEDSIQTLLIEDVVNENKMNFFREPRLGCYLALDLTYKTSLSYTSLLSAIQCTKNYEEAKAAQEQRKKEWSDKQEEIKNQINQIKEEIAKEEEAKRLAEEKALEAKAAQEAAAAAANNENPPEGEGQDQAQNSKPEEQKEQQSQQPQQPQQPPQNPVQPQAQNPAAAKKGDQPLPDQENPIEALEKQLTEWTEEPVQLAEYDKDETKILLCLDTLGQDRVFTDEEIKFIKMIGMTIKDSMEKLEQKLIEKDRDIRIKFMELETKIKSQDKYSDEKSEELMNFTVNQFYASDEYKSKGITEEDEKIFEGDLVRMKYLREAYLSGEFKEALETFQAFEFVEFSKIFQNLLYFCKANPLDINEDKTNKLEWKKAKKYWYDIFNVAKNYNPLGPKPEEVKSIYKLNKIKDNLELAIAKRDEVKSYSKTLLMFVDFILFLIKVRHDDIIRRICNVAILKDKREQIIKTNAEIDEERQKIIDEAKALNPNVKVPEVGEPIVAKPLEEENKEEEKKEEEKKEEEKPKEDKPKEEEKPKDEQKPKEEQKTNEEQKPNEEQNNQPAEQQNPQNVNGEEAKDAEEQTQEKIDEKDSLKLAEQLMKFDEEHVKQEVPPDVDYDIDNDYDIDQSEKDTLINAALQSVNGPQINPLDKSKLITNNPKPVNPVNPANPQS